ncbi:glycosyltransferase 87 family protein [Haloarcula marismortui]|uniref:glycosyltransferase 87 family protein n=1 Tax=Haloarcula marismortui TaxID=2238 RepID=UPI003C78BDB7
MLEHLNRKLLTVLVLGLILRIGAVLLFSGAHFDIDSYLIVANAVQNFQNIYITAPNRYPYFPGWAVFEVGALYLSQYSGVPFDILIRLPGVVADTAIILVLYVIVDRGYGNTLTTPSKASTFHAINPVAIMVIGAHGMFDSIPILSMLLCGLLLFEGNHRTAATILGIGIVIKQVPLLFGLLFLIMCASNKERAEFAFFSALPTGVLSVPFLIVSPLTYLKRTIGFEGGPILGWYRELSLLHNQVPGITLGQLGDQILAAWPVVQSINTPLLIIPLLSSTSYLFYRNRDILDIWTSIAISILVFYTVSAALHPEYLYWIAPFTCLISVNKLWTVIYTAVVFLTGSSWYIWIGQMEIKYMDVLQPIFSIQPELISLYIFAFSNLAFWTLSFVGILLCLHRTQIDGLPLSGLSERICR